MLEDSGSGGRDAFTLDAVVEYRKSLEEYSGCGCRDRQPTVGARNAASAEGQRRARPTRRATAFDQPGGSNDIGDRVPSTDFVECHLVNDVAVHRGLGLGE